MWIAVCDNCNNPYVFVSRIGKGEWALNAGNAGKDYKQNVAVHACSRECATHLDTVKPFPQENEK